MALRGAQQMAQRLLMQQQVQPAALLDRCAGGAAQLLSAGAHWQVWCPCYRRTKASL